MAFEIDILALVASQSRWEIFEYILSGLVALGCLGEFIHECTGWFQSHPLWKKSGGTASALLLVAALAVEIPTQFKVNSISGIITHVLGKQEAETRIRAAEIERKYAWRTILPEKSAAFLAALGGQKFSLILQYFVSDPEAYEFASDFEGVLAKSHLIVTPQNIVPLVPPLGIVLLGPDSPNKAALANALTAAGLAFRSTNVQLTAIDDLNALRISIGGRSPPK